MGQQKFVVTQTVVVEAQDVKQAAAKATEVIRHANRARYQVVDRMGYTFNVDMDESLISEART